MGAKDPETSTLRLVALVARGLLSALLRRDIRPFFFPAALFGVFGGIALAYLWDDAPLWRRRESSWRLFALLLVGELSRMRTAIVPGFS